MKKFITLFAVASLSTISTASANVKLAALFSDHMVLQREMPVPVWGWADKDEDVTVSVAGQTKTAKPGADGKWTVTLDPLKAGDGLTLTAKGKNTLTVNDVLVGEVWLGSGQSNMGLTVERANDLEAETAAANHPKLRMFTVTSAASPTPQQDCVGKWVICAPTTVGKFSAALYFTGRDLHKALDVPMGLINSSVGGTPIESWIRADAQNATPELKGFFEATEKAARTVDAARQKENFERATEKWKKDAADAKAAGKPAPRRPRDPSQLEKKRDVGGLYNGKIAPLVPYALRGVIWYQGEANTVPAKAIYYQYQMPLLVTDWRKQWGRDDIPFAWVQLPNYGVADRDISLVREGMLKALKVPHTGMAIAIDIGEANNIHPKNKQEVGHRLSLWALGTVYNQKVPTTSGPLPAGHEIKGGDVALSFTHTDQGLVAKGGELKGFVIAGPDKKFIPATARIDGDKVIVSSPQVTEPTAVRYAWENNPTCNLYNGAGLPASPFRTDDWPVDEK